MEQHSNWPPRPRVLIVTRTLPQFSEFVCGGTFGDDELAHLLFHPAVAAAAQMVASDIRVLTSLGVQLQSVHLNRLEWDLESGLHDSLQRFGEANSEGEEARVSGSAAVLTRAELSGYSVDPEVADLIRGYDQALETASDERERRENVEAVFSQLVAAAGGTKKARRRVNRALADAGLDISGSVANKEEGQGDR